MKPAIFSTCNVCGRTLIHPDELATGMCAVCANEELQEIECAGCHKMFMGTAEERLCAPCEQKGVLTR